MFSKQFFTIALLASAGAVQASPDYVITKSVDIGPLSQPYTSSLGESLTPFAAAFGSSDFFVADYGFSTAVAESFSAASVTFDLGNTLQLSNLSLSLLIGTAYAGPTPSTLSGSELTSIALRTVSTSVGDSTTQSLSMPLLPAGDYVIEVRGQVTGVAGGSYGGVMNLAAPANISAVPEPRSALLAVLGAGLLGVVGRRRPRRA